jgi:flagellar motility protein MotE (MotC chaperone)
MKQIRFLPLVALAIFALLGLKLAALVMNENDMLAGTVKTMAKTPPSDAPAGGMAEKSGKSGNEQAQKAGGAKKMASADPGAGAEAASGKAKDGRKQPPRDVKALGGEDNYADAETRLLASLAARRRQLDERENKLSLRLNLLKAAQKRIDERLARLKRLEAKIAAFSKKRKEERGEKFRRLVKMYAAMKPKDAARIFNRLDRKVLLGIAHAMKPQSMSAILAAMEPEKAREMTMALAGGGEKGAMASGGEGAQLPQIVGQ